VAVFYQEVDMAPQQYSPEFRREVCERLLAGEAVKDLMNELSIGHGTLYRWRRQALIDAGRRPGTKSYEADELARTRRRVKELEAELRLVKLASELFDEAAHDPKGSTRLFEG
jgi:transposase-like protein